MRRKQMLLSGMLLIVGAMIAVGHIPIIGEYAHAALIPAGTSRTTTTTGGSTDTATQTNPKILPPATTTAGTGTTADVGSGTTSTQTGSATNAASVPPRTPPPQPGSTPPAVLPPVSAYPQPPMPPTTMSIPPEKPQSGSQPTPPPSTSALPRMMPPPPATTANTSQNQNVPPVPVPAGAVAPMRKPVPSPASQRTEQVPGQAAAKVIERFNPIERSQMVANLLKKESRKDIAKALPTEPTAQQTDPSRTVIKSSIRDLELLVRAEAGTTTRLDMESRPIAILTHPVGPSLPTTTASEQLAQPKPVTDVRIVGRADAIDVFRDTDGDGISDYDELHLYHTDPYNAHTSGSQLTDGERLMLGLDLHSTSSVRIAAESPREGGVTAADIFTVDAIRFAPVATSSTVQALLASTTPSVATSTIPERGVELAGHALPNSFVSLYIFSTPIVVTVKADASGTWRYTLNKQLENGAHEAYVAIMDGSGKIVAKSSAIPFVQRAEAIDFTPLQIPSENPTSFADILEAYIPMIAFGGFLLFGVLALTILGLRSSKNTIPPAPTARV